MPFSDGAFHPIDFVPPDVWSRDCWDYVLPLLPGGVLGRSPLLSGVWTFPFVLFFAAETGVPLIFFFRIDLTAVAGLLPELELPLTSIDEIMRRIGVKASNITDEDGKQQRPLYCHKEAGPHTYDMYRSHLAEEEITFSNDNAAFTAPAKSTTNIEASREVHEVEEFQETPVMARQIAEYHAMNRQDSDGNLIERADNSEH